MIKRAPLIVAIVLLLLPVIYVGSYLALVTPQGTFAQEEGGPIFYQSRNGTKAWGHFITYRHWNTTSSRIFWPLELADRKLRPKQWAPGYERELLSGGAHPVSQ